MPAVSGSPTYNTTSCTTTDQLESIEAAQFHTGDEASISDGVAVPVLYTLDTTSVTARAVPAVLYTRDSNPAYNGGITTAPGRWLRKTTTYA